MGQYRANGPIAKLNRESYHRIIQRGERKIYSRLSLLSPENIRDSEMGRAVEPNAVNFCHTVLLSMV